MATALTDAKLKGLKPPATGQLEISDAIVPGLRIRVGKGGARTFIVRKRIAGTPRNITVGRFGPRFGLAEARKKARSILSDIEAGKDPSGPSKRPTGRGDSLRALWPAYRADKAHLRTLAEVERIFDKYILPDIGDRLADAVTRGDVTRLIDSIAATSPVMARNVLAQLSSFYTWALPRLDRLPANPCRDAGRPRKPESRDRVLTDAELAALWRIAQADKWPWGPGLLLLILTGQRRSEVFGAAWAEFDLKTRIWTIPAERAKNRGAHIVPLSEAALDVLKSLPRSNSSDLLFPAIGNPDAPASGVEKAVQRWRKEISKAFGKPVPHWRLHDIRRTVATGLQRQGVRIDVTEAVLNHTSGSRAGIVGVYQRHEYTDEKRKALDAWAQHVAGLAL
jgi:integrase